MQVRDSLNVEVTRKQFLQYMASALLMLFGLDNLISLLTGNAHVIHHISDRTNSMSEGFGARKFGE